MHSDTLAAAKALAQSIIKHGDTVEINDYGQMAEHLADLIEDFGEDWHPSLFIALLTGVDSMYIIRE